MKTTRVVKPEILDDLDPSTPAAMHSRRDLKRLNRIMGNAYWIARAIRGEQMEVQTIAELGGGDGTFLLSLLERLKTRGIKPKRAFIVDRQSIVAPETRLRFRAAGCDLETRQMDVLSVDHTIPQADVIIGNLFLHHFEGRALEQLLERASLSANCFIGCEPRRWRIAPYTMPLLRLIGCNDVTMHDAKASVEAGFWDGELSAAWGARSDWKLREQIAGPFSHLFVARKIR